MCPKVKAEIGLVICEQCAHYGGLLMNRDNIMECGYNAEKK